MHMPKWKEKISISKKKTKYRAIRNKSKEMSTIEFSTLI